MNNKCIYLKQKFNKKLECKYKKLTINIKDCANCPFKEYKMHNNSQIKCKNQQKTAKSPVKTGKTGIKPEKIKKRSSKLAKLERNRTSLFTDDMDYCYFCKKDKQHIHEVIFGRNRVNSMKFGLTLPLCEYHHRMMHSNTDLIEEYKRKGQVLFEKTYPDLDFIEIFWKNYL